MSSESGRNLKAKIGDGASPEAFNNIGARSVSLRINGQMVEITDNNGAGWREGHDGGGVRSVSIQIQGAYRAGTEEVLLRTKALAQTQFNAEIELEGSLKMSGGKWQCTSYEHSGEVDGVIGYQATLESSGALAIA